MQDLCHKGGAAVRQLCAAAILLCLALSAPATYAAEDATTAPAVAGPSDTGGDARIKKLELLTRQILLKEIELERFNMHFRQVAGRQGRWKGWRYFVTQEANYGLTQAGVIETVYQRMKAIEKPHHPNHKSLEAAAIPQIIGPILASTGSAVEFGINAFHQYQAYKKGLSPGVAKKRIWALSQEISEMLKERKKLIEEEKQATEYKLQAQIAEIEGEVLEDIEQLSVAEYRFFHLDARRLLAFQQSLYILDIVKNGIGAVANGVSYQSERQSNRLMNQPLGILTTISGALIVATPLVARGIGKGAVAYHERRLHLQKSTREVVSRAIEKLHADTAQLQSLCKQAQGKEHRLAQAASRLALYGSINKDVLAEMEEGLREQRAGNLSATEQVLTGAFNGATKVANGTLLTVVGTVYPENPTITNSNLAAGATTYLVGNSWALLDNIRIQVKREYANRKLARKHALPDQLIQERLTELDQMESTIRSTK